MDKKQKTLFSTILIVTLLIVFLAGCTIAKYNATYLAKIDTEIAKFNFNVTGWSATQTKEIKLQDTLALVSLEDEKIAPGTAGQFKIEIDASDSNVDVEYHVDVSEVGTLPENIKFRVVKEDEMSFINYSSLTELANSELTGIISKTDSNKIQHFIINWEWPYESYESIDIEDKKTLEDAKDTKIGTGNMKNSENMFDYVAYVNVIGSQVKL